MTNNFVFRALPGESVESEEQLLDRVALLGTELMLQGQVHDFHSTLGSRWSDKSGPAVVVPIRGPTGWHFHQDHTLQRHGLKCAPYP